VIVPIKIIAQSHQQTDLKDFKVINGAYMYEYSQVIPAHSEVIYSVLNNHEKINLLNPNVEVSTIISQSDDGLKRLLKINQCILFFCFKMRLVEHVVERENEIESTIIPDESDFSEGYTHWRIDSLGPNRTRITLTARQKPNFWIPPLIGEPIIKSVLTEQLRITFNSIRLIAQKKMTHK
jgi:ribosome-associated toxin RatA of RatAB toxin-antitoxin module